MIKTKEEIEKMVEDIYKNSLHINYRETLLDENNIKILNAVIHQIREEDDKERMREIKEMIEDNLIPLPNEAPYVPFYKPYGMSDEEYTLEVGEANQKLGEYQAIEEHNKIFEDILQKLDNLNK